MAAYLPSRDCGGVEDIDRAARELADRFRFRAPRLDFRPLTPAPPPIAAAVDGSSATLLDAGGLLVLAWRSATAWEEGGRTRAVAGPLRLRLVDRKRDDEPPLDGLRAREEAAAALDALSTLPAGGLLLLDGPPPPEVAARVAEAAGARLVAAVSKSSGMSLDGTPVLAAVRRAARGVAAPWAAAVGEGRFALRASAAQDALFLVDPIAGDADAVLAAVASLGTNPGVPGYPYVLALAHQRAVLAEEEQEDARATLLAKAAEAGADAREMEMAFHDYHEDLDLGA